MPVTQIKNRKTNGKAGLCCGLLGLSLLFAGTAVANVSEQEQRLVERLFASQAARRNDLVQDARQRLAMVAPEHPEVLALDMQDALKKLDLVEQKRLVELALGSGNMDLQQRLQALERLAQADGKMALQQARLLAAGGNFEVAVQAYQSLFADQPPLFELALEYWKAVSNLQARKVEAMQKLYQLNQEYPGNADLQLLLSQLMFSVDRSGDALDVLHSIQGGTAADRDKAAELEYSHLIRIPVSAGSVTVLDEFLRRYPESSFHASAQKNLQAQKKLLASPGWQAAARGRKLLELERYAEAEPFLRQGIRAYPDNGDLHGALAHALMNLERYEEAEHYFSLATRKIAVILGERSKDQDIPIIESEAAAWLAKWESLRLYNQSQLAIKRGDKARDAGDLAGARRAYLQARRVLPDEVTSYIRLHELELAAGNEQAAQDWLFRVQRSHPQDDRVIYALVGFYRERNPAQAMAILERLPAKLRTRFADLRLSLLLEQLEREIDQALERDDTALALHLLRQAHEYSPADPWIVYRLASLLVQMQDVAGADRVFAGLLGRQKGNPAAHYAHALYLSGLQRDEEALRALDQVARAQWTQEMQELQHRVARRLREREAEALFVAGQHQRAIDLILQEQGVEQHARVADWYRELGQDDKAAGHYLKILQQEPENFTALLGMAEIRFARGRHKQAAGYLQKARPTPNTEGYLVRRMAELWVALGNKARAVTLYENLLEHAPGDAHSYRNLARLQADIYPKKALDYYARGLVASQALAPAALEPLDLPALTAATRQKLDDDWLAGSLKADTENLYRMQNTSIQVQQNFGWRTDSEANGLSDLKRHTSIVRLDTPVAGGSGFVQAEQVILNAARPGTYLYGLCSKVVEQCMPGSQNASGTGFALGWQGRRWSWDLGHSPLGFGQQNWLGGIGYTGDWRKLGYDLTLSRRPMNNSIVSYAGARDPVTGARWGGVTANGLTLGLSYDQGGAGGVWASLGAHKLAGRHVQDNNRLTLMTGYYHRLLDEVDRRLRIGLTLMHWRYDKGMDEFTLGQGGYYSPQRYVSVGFPVSYAWRNYDWSILLESSLSWSTSSYNGGDQLYIKDADRKILEAGYTPSPAARLHNDSSRSSGLGVRNLLLAERRLSDHWVVGGGFDWGYSKDYSPSQAFLYLRYVFKPWRGNLMLPIEPLAPYADWK